MMRLLTLTLLAVVPGGLPVVAAFVLGRAIVRQMQLEQGTHGHRFARAVSTIRFGEVWSQARQTFGGPFTLKAS